MPQEVILLKLGEIALKGLNRKAFEDVLLKNIRRRLQDAGDFSVSSRQGFSTESCSAAVVTILFPKRLRAWTAPKMAKLLDSVPPLVKTTSSGWAPSRRATRARASSSCFRA